jgi:hypothetical protein
MALVVAPTVGYDSFVSVAKADAYFAEQSYAAWAAASAAAKEVALRVGAVYVTAKRPTPGSVSPVVHPRLEIAAMEAAKLSLAGTLYKAGYTQAVVEKTLGPLTIKYANPQLGQTFTSQPYIDDLLVGLTYGSNGPVFFERV